MQGKETGIVLQVILNHAGTARVNFFNEYLKIKMWLLRKMIDVFHLGK